MIPMSCPSCGRRGNVPLDRLNTRMHCKKCDAVFHLDATGKPMLGEPPSAKGSKSKSARAKNEPLDPIGIVAAKLAKTPKPIWMTAAVLCSIALLYNVYGFFAAPGPTPAQSLNAQMVTAAKAVLDKDLPTLKQMCTSDSHDEITQAVDVFHSMLGPVDKKLEEDSILLGQPPDGNEGCVNISIVMPMTADGNPGPPPVDMDLCWIKGDRWYLNGKATLEMMKSRAEMKAEEKKTKKR